MCALAERRERRLMVGHLLQYHPAFIKLRELVQRGRARAFAIHLFEPSQSRQGPARGGHSVVLRAPRPLDDPVARRRGAERRHRRKAATTCTRRSPMSRRRTWRFPAASRRMSSCRGCIRSRSRSSWSSAIARWRCSTTASHGTASCCSTRTASNGARPCRCRSAPRPIPLPLDEGEPLKLECQHFLDCIASGGRPRTDGREGLRVLRVSGARRATR